MNIMLSERVVAWLCERFVVVTGVIAGHPCNDATSATMKGALAEVLNAAARAVQLKMVFRRIIMQREWWVDINERIRGHGRNG
jgi:hypothetical protein